MDIEHKFLRVTMPDRSKWKIPVRIIAEDRARYYSEKEHTEFEYSLQKTLELFEEDLYKIEDWVSNNMYWSEVGKFAIQERNSPMSYEDFQEGLVNGEKVIIEEL